MNITLQWPCCTWCVPFECHTLSYALLEGRVSYLRYLCLLTYSAVQHILCRVVCFVCPRFVYHILSVSQCSLTFIYSIIHVDRCKQGKLNKYAYLYKTVVSHKGYHLFGNPSNSMFRFHIYIPVWHHDQSCIHHYTCEYRQSYQWRLYKTV